jgi:NifB/MoaA-like Fe-S oxidoreductase
MRAAVDRFNERTGAALEVVPVENVYLGSEINVSGLLTGLDLRQAFTRRPGDGPVYISDRMVSQRTGTLLDDATVEDVATAIGRPVVAAGQLSEVARDLARRQRPCRAA